MMNHEQAVEFLGAYALDAVEPHEAGSIESHLLTCEACFREVAEFREVAALLASTVEGSPQLWHRIVSEVEEFERAKPKWKGWAVAASVAIALAGLGGLAVLQQNKLADLQVALDAERVAVTRQASVVEGQSFEGQLRSVLADPSARLMTLAGEDGLITFVVLPDGSAFVAESTLPSLGPDRTYQLWAVTDGQFVSAAVLGTDPQATPLRIEGTVEVLAITEEILGGVVVSQQDPSAVWLADA